MNHLAKAWSREAILELFDLPFNDLLWRAHETHRRHWDVNRVQLSTLVSVKSGGCAEDCKYCGQSGHHDEVKLEATRLMPLAEVLDAAKAAKEQGASRLCMGAAWRNPKDRDMPALLEMVAGVKAAGLETCMTLGMLSDSQAEALKQAGLDYYNHNIDTSPEFYGEIVTTRTFQDRLNTLSLVRRAGLKICSGGILGMGEGREDRAGMIQALANLDPPPESVPINVLVPIPGTPLEKAPSLDPLELVRTVAVARLAMPVSRIRLSAGRNAMSDECQALCFFAGANSVFYGERLLTTDNRSGTSDDALFAKLGLAGGAAD
ncbi:MAG: biotin synthase BioB [Magnetospirillum sp. WYHS-4]